MLRNTNNKYIENYGKNIISSYLENLDENNSYVWECLKNCSETVLIG